MPIRLVSCGARLLEALAFRINPTFVPPVPAMPPWTENGPATSIDIDDVWTVESDEEAAPANVKEVFPVTTGATPEKVDPDPARPRSGVGGD